MAAAPPGTPVTADLEQAVVGIPIDSVTQMRVISSWAPEKGVVRQ